MSIAALTREGRVTELPGIGATLEQKIRADRDRRDPGGGEAAGALPAGLVAITRLPGLGPEARAAAVRRARDRLARGAARPRRRAHQLRGCGASAPKFEESVLAALDAGDAEARGRGSCSTARSSSASDRRRAARSPGARPRRDRRLGAARGRDASRTSTSSPRPAGAARPPRRRRAVRDRRAQRRRRRARAHAHGLVVELRAVAPEQFGNLLQHLTGSAAHNVALRERAVRKGLHLSEYGVLDDATGETHRCATEEEVYALVGLPSIAPSCARTAARSLDAGDAAGAGRAGRPARRPALHTIASDGRDSIEEMALAARERGLEYLAITDHSASHGFGDDVYARRAAPPDRARARGSTRASTASRCSPAARSTSCRTARSTTTTTCSPSSTG